MLFNDNARFIFYNKPVRMYKSFDSLMSIVMNELNIELISNVYVFFVNQDKNMLKILFFERGHIAIFAMRLSGNLLINFGENKEFTNHSFDELITNLKIKKKKGFIPYKKLHLNHL